VSERTPRGPRAAIAGVAFSQVGRRLPQTLGNLAVSACKRAIEDAGLRIEDIDGVATYSQPSKPMTGTAVDGVDLVDTSYLPQALGLQELSWSCTVDRGTVTAAVIEAANALAAGNCKYALVWRAMHNPPGRYGTVLGDTAGGEAQFTYPWGLGHPVALHSMPYSRYMAKYGATREHMATYIVRNRANAQDTAETVFPGQLLSREDYLSARMIADPLSILDCDMPVDGCGALVLTTPERARDLRHPPAYVTGGASAGLPPNRTVVPTLESMMEAAKRLARALWRDSGLSAKDIRQAQLYDGYSWFIYAYLEAFGIFPEGEAFAALQDETTARSGRLPLNTNGGALGMGRLHGTPQLIEAVLQIQRRCGARQIADPSVALVCTGAPWRGFAAITLGN
jgi:acetyl-CoA acetyltransferase